MSVGCAEESPFAPEPNPLPQNTAVGEDIWCVLPEFVWSDVVASLLEGLLGITLAGGDRLTSLEELEAAYETQLPASETATRVKIAPSRDL